MSDTDRADAMAGCLLGCCAGLPTILTAGFWVLVVVALLKWIAS